MIRQLEQLKKDRMKNGLTNNNNPSSISNNSNSGPVSTLPVRGGVVNTCVANSSNLIGGNHHITSSSRLESSPIITSNPNVNSETYECIALHISPDLGERIMLSGERTVLDEVFPETNQAIMDARSGVAWNQHDTRHVIRFPLNGYCKLNSVQAITRLLNANFHVVASNGGGVEGQQFSEYLFVRKVYPG